MEAWREVARRIAHEIKNPLTPIQLSAQRIRRRFGARLVGDSGDARSSTSASIRSRTTSRASRCWSTSSRTSRGCRPPIPGPTTSTRSSPTRWRATRAPRAWQFETDLDETLPTVDLDREQIRRALTNLIDNAIAAVVASGRRLAGARGPGTAANRARPGAPERAAGGRRRRRRAFRARIAAASSSRTSRRSGTAPASVSPSCRASSPITTATSASTTQTPRGTRFVVELPVRGA